MHKPQLEKRRPALLDALVKLWDADVALIQKQTHANEQDVSLTVNDGAEWCLDDVPHDRVRDDP